MCETGGFISPGWSGPGQEEQGEGAGRAGSISVRAYPQEGVCVCMCVCVTYMCVYMCIHTCVCMHLHSCPSQSPRSGALSLTRPCLHLGVTHPGPAAQHEARGAVECLLRPQQGHLRSGGLLGPGFPLLTRYQVYFYHCSHLLQGQGRMRERAWGRGRDWHTSHCCVLRAPPTP